MRLRARAAVPTEAQEQAVLIQWWDHYARTKGIDPRVLFAVPNGAILGGDARLRAIQMGKLKRTGLRVGVPDLMLAKMNVNYGGLFIEMKRKGEKVKSGSEQESMMAALRWRGYHVIECAGADAAMQAIKDYLA